MCISGSPVSINFADVDKLRLKKPHSELLPCNMPINVKLTAAETAMGDLFATLLGKSAFSALHFSLYVLVLK